MKTNLENPILNSPYAEPKAYWAFAGNQITDVPHLGRRLSTSFMPIAAPARRQRNRALPLDDIPTLDLPAENELVNQIRVLVGSWRAKGRPGLSAASRELLEYWLRPNRQRRLYFAQVEAVETAMFLAEAADREGAGWILQALRTTARDVNRGLYRTAFKLATGAGKTAVMAMIIAWQTLNRRSDPSRGIFSDCFLVVAPGITIRDRLLELRPDYPRSTYKQLDLVPPERETDLGSAIVKIISYHAFLPREEIATSKLSRQTLGRPDGFKESDAVVADRVCGEFGRRRNIVVLNDEAHHCYLERAAGQEEEADDLSGEDRRDAADQNEEARRWLLGLLAIDRKFSIRNVFDLSATPYYLKGSGHREGTIFPWVVSDFGLMDAIEAGLVKVPRLPVSDNADESLPKYRNLWPHIEADLPKRVNSAQQLEDSKRLGPPQLPVVLEGALRTLYGHYSARLDEYLADERAQAEGRMAPVFIVVCNNTRTSKLIYDWIAGAQLLVAGVANVRAGSLTAFSNEDAYLGTGKPRTLLIDSKQLDRDDNLSAEFKRLAGGEISRWKDEYRSRMPGHDAEELTDEDLMREVLNSVGKRGRLGESIRCVVSVSMLTEGWDANTVTHILGVRAFGSQLLCEQVIGRGLRRQSFAMEPRTVEVEGQTIEFESFSPEYADVFGIPFQAISRGNGPPPPQRDPVHVRALPEREPLSITFPRVVRYRWELPKERLDALFGTESHMFLTRDHVPTEVLNLPVVGRSVVLNLDALKAIRRQEVEFLLARLVLEKYYRADWISAPTLEVDIARSAERQASYRSGASEWGPDSALEAFRFPDLLKISRRWLDECVTCGEGAFIQLLSLAEMGHRAADRIQAGITRRFSGTARILPVLHPYEPHGTTVGAEMFTRKAVVEPNPLKNPFNYVICDTEFWEQTMARCLDDMPEVLRYIKNEGQALSFLIPYEDAGLRRDYMPDFIVWLDDGRGDADPLKVIVECKGRVNQNADDKKKWTESYWLPAVNNLGTYGRWDYLLISQDPSSTPYALRQLLMLRKSGARHGTGAHQ